MRLNDTLSGLLLVIFGIVVGVSAVAFTETAGHKIGPGVFPGLIGGGMALGGAVLAWSGRNASDVRWLALEEWVAEPRLALNAALVVGALIFYALAVDTMGFFITAFVFLAVLFLAFGVSRRWIAPLAILVTLGLHFAFYTLLRVPLPWGWLESLAW